MLWYRGHSDFRRLDGDNGCIVCNNQRMDYALVLGAFGVGIVVGLTGMGGGALMTPMLVIFFGVPPLAAISSDLVASAVMKPVGWLVHLQRKTVNLRLVGFLCIGSVPSAFCGVLILRAFGDSPQVQATIKFALGCALLLTAVLLTVRAYLRLVERANTRDGQGSPLSQDRPEVHVKVIATIVLGAIGGLIVGLTSVGSGSLIIIGFDGHVLGAAREPTCGNRPGAGCSAGRIRGARPRDLR